MASLSASDAVESKASSDSKALHKRAVRWEVAVIITLFGAWTAAYFCRCSLPHNTPAPSTSLCQPPYHKTCFALAPLRVPLFLVEKEFQVEEGVNDKLLGIMMAGGYTGIAYSAFVFVVTFESQTHTHTSTCAP